MQSDGLSVYDAFDQLPNIILYACMAHIRRKYVDAQTNDKQRAEWVLQKIQDLYALEREARESNHTPKQQLQIRQQKAVSIMEEIKTWLDKQYNDHHVLP